jgi:hypothetical protein
MSTTFLSRIRDERAFLRHQFPMVTPTNDPPTVYEGFCRCEKGPVKELADKGAWPFTEYVQMHRFRLELPNEYPLKPPVATWLTEISHPNIVPLLRGVVCVSVLGKEWKPDLKLPSVINSLFYLLVDPNPDDVWNHPKCLKAAEALRRHGFPKKGKEKPPSAAPSDIVRFNIIDLPKSAPSDVVRFTIPGRKPEEEKQ